MYILTSRHRPGYRTAARRARRPGGNAERRNLPGASLRPARFATGDAARWGAKPRSSRWCGRRTAGCGRRTAPGLPHSEVAAPALPAHAFPAPPEREDFDSPNLPLDFQWLRSPWPEELFSLTERPGYLRLYGRETLGSLFRQSLVARRQQSHCFSAETVMEFEPDRFQQMAGLICYYNGSKFHYLYVSHDEDLGKHVRVMSCLPDQLQSDVFSAPIAIPAGVPVHLRVEVDYERLYFAYRIGGQEWSWLPGRSMRAFCPMRRRLPALRISRARLSACVARIWREPAGMRTSTTSSTGSAAISPTRSPGRVRFCRRLSVQRQHEACVFQPWQRERQIRTLTVRGRAP